MPTYRAPSVAEHWMLPLGLLLMASDVPFLRKPVGHLTIWGADKWVTLRQWVVQRLGRWAQPQG